MAVETTSGGETEVLGGLVFPLSSVGGNVPVMDDAESETSYSVVTRADSLADNYNLLVKEVRDGATREFRDAEAEPRATGSAVVPLFSGD